MAFLPVVEVPCEGCGGARFDRTTLEAKLSGRSIADVLALTVREAREVFANVPKLSRCLELLDDGEEGHLDTDAPLTLALGAAAGARVEGEAVDGEAARARLGRPREQLAERVEHPDVGRRHRARRAPDRRLIDLGRARDALDALDQDGPGLAPHRGEHRAEEDVAHERGLPGARDAAHGDEGPERHAEVHALQVPRARVP